MPVWTLANEGRSTSEVFQINLDLAVNVNIAARSLRGAVEAELSFYSVQ
jgi:hypothetical protein